LPPRRPKEEPATPRRRRPASTPTARENQLIAKAVDLAEKQLEEGTASAQVISHYLKMGSSREQLEQERLANENILLKAKAEALETQKQMVVLYEQAIVAMRSYSPLDEAPIEGVYDDDEG
jgi:hypothetical protein